VFRSDGSGWERSSSPASRRDTRTSPEIMSRGSSPSRAPLLIVGILFFLELVQSQRLAADRRTWLISQSLEFSRKASAGESKSADLRRLRTDIMRTDVGPSVGMGLLPQTPIGALTSRIRRGLAMSKL
jgi:hypothetical protein